MKKTIARLSYALSVLFILLLFALNFVAYSFNGIITAALCGEALNIDPTSQEAKVATALATNIAEEGITLLKNENDALPLQKDASGELKVNVFGKSSSDTCFVYQGYGSGGGSREAAGQVSLYTAFRNAGITLNEDLVEKYNALKGTRIRSIVIGGADAEEIFEAPNSFYSDELLTEAKAFSDTAVVVISRALGEGYDAYNFQRINGEVRNDRHHLELTQEEEYMLDKVGETFENVIVVLNSTNIMEVGFLEKEYVDAALTMYAPGNNAVEALPKLLKGDVTPSGKTVDTWAYDFTTAATWANAGGSHHRIAQGSYINYAESIYTGYYWYETADAEGYWADVNNEYGSGYEGVVQYPFGYGLSYTNFEWSVQDVSLVNNSNLTADSEITFQIFVENTGAVKGQDVVQLYNTAPYTKGGIEKPSVKLIGFAKTSVLEPGAGELLTITVDAYDLASYDVYDSNDNGFMGYEVEEGKYTLSLRTDAHTVATLENNQKANFTYNVNEGILFENDPDTGNPVTNRFTTYTNPISGASSTYVELSMSKDSKAYSIDGSDAGRNITYLTRADFKGTFPQVTATQELSAELIEKSYKVNSPVIDETDEMPITGSTATAWTVYDLFGIPYEDPMWEELVSQLTIKEMADLCMNGGWGTNAIPSIGKERTDHADGPSGFNKAMSSMSSGYATNYPCATLVASTWNWKLAYQFGLAFAAEGELANVQGLYGIACNMHRSPVGGRNFEYYSEDPLIAGIMTAYFVIGAQEGGMYCFIKHLALNEIDLDRHGKYTWTTEQAFREIYLKPFEYAVKLGNTKALMNAYNRIGSTRASGSYAMNTGVVREEWGFQGMIISDYYAGNNSMDEDEFIRAGTDLKLFPGGKAADLDDMTSATAVKFLQKCSKNILYTTYEVRYMKATAEGLDMSAVLGTKEDIFAWWIPILIAIDVIVVLACAVWCIAVHKNLKLELKNMNSKTYKKKVNR